MQTTGIYIEHNANGTPTFARIDLNKYGTELIEFFSAKGISIEETYNDPKLVAKIRIAEKQESKKLDLSKYGISL